MSICILVVSLAGCWFRIQTSKAERVLQFYLMLFKVGFMSYFVLPILLKAKWIFVVGKRKLLLQSITRNFVISVRKGFLCVPRTCCLV